MECVKIRLVLLMYLILIIDPTSYKSIKEAEREYAQIYDRNHGWKYVNCYVFMASYNDQPDIKFLVDPEIPKQDALDFSTRNAEMYGRIPMFFRSCVRLFWILPGTKSIAGQSLKIRKS